MIFVFLVGKEAQRPLFFFMGILCPSLLSTPLDLSIPFCSFPLLKDDTTFSHSLPFLPTLSHSLLLSPTPSHTLISMILSFSHSIPFIRTPSPYFPLHCTPFHSYKKKTLIPTLFHFFQSSTPSEKSR